MIHLIGGIARCGKSTLADVLRSRHGCDVLDLDMLRYSLAPVLGLDELIETPERLPRDPSTAAKWHGLLDAREDAVWAVAGRYARAAAWDDTDLIVCGTLRPEHADELVQAGIAAGAVFLTGSDLANRIESIARSTAPNNWLSGWTPADRAVWAELAQERSRRVAQSAQRLGFTVIDTADRELIPA